jgi:hypothetical protein
VKPLFRSWQSPTCPVNFTRRVITKTTRFQGATYERVSKTLDNEINNINNDKNNKHSLRSNTKVYGGKTHYTDSQNSETTAPSGRELYHFQFYLQAASPEVFGYTLVPESLSHTHSATRVVSYFEVFLLKFCIYFNSPLHDSFPGLSSFFNCFLHPPLTFLLFGPISKVVPVF